MASLSTASPAEFVTDFFTSFTTELLRDDADPEEVFDRFYTPDVRQISDGIELDRARLIAHLRPVRANLVSSSFDVHEAVAHGDRLAARFTVDAELRQGRTVTEVAMFAEFTPGGRLRCARQLTRTVKRRDPA